MWSVVSLVRQGLRWPRRGRRTARVVDESALGHAAGEGVDGAVFAVPPGGGGGVAAALARALLALACTIRFDGEEGGGAVEEAWASSGWRPRADEVSHLMVRESMRYAIYA